MNFKKPALLVTALLVALPLISTTVTAQEKTRLSIATGGTGGVYYPLGGGIASILSKQLPKLEATAEVTSASVDNIKLVAAGKADIGMSLADTVWDGYNGSGKFEAKAPIRALLVLYPARTHVVTIAATGISKMADLKGKRISTGAAGSGTEVVAVRLLAAYGIDPEKDVQREKLSVAESVSALRDRKIDAIFFSGGMPTAAFTDLAATPGMQIKMIDHADGLKALVDKYGPLYINDTIPAKMYPGQDKDNQIISVWNLLVVNEKMDNDLAYKITKTIFENQADLVLVHKEALNMVLADQLKGGSPIPFHPGAMKYFREKGLKAK